MSPRIRLAREDDARQMLDIYAPIVRETAISFELEPPSVSAYRDRVRQNLEPLPWLVCEQEAAILGFAYASRFRPRAAYQWTVETTVYVSPQHHRRGVARGLYVALIACLRLQGFETALAVIALPNVASVALHESLGFRCIGVFEGIGYKLGRWHDVGFWHLPIHARADAPTPPRPISSLARTDDFAKAMSRGAQRVGRAGGGGGEA